MISLALLKLNLVFASLGDSCPRPDSNFFFLPNWWQYIPSGRWHEDILGKCSASYNLPGDIWPVGLAIVDMLLGLAGFIAVISIIVAGIQYMTTLGNPEKGVSARKRIVNSLIGLAIVLIAIALVSFIGNSLKIKP